jgi:uncharacterized CHY-type Zn-finger protein
MIAIKCDRCGAYYDIYNVKNNSEKTNGIMFLNIDKKGNYFEHKVIDLCPECMEAVKKIVEQAEKKN